MFLWGWARKGLLGGRGEMRISLGRSSLFAVIMWSSRNVPLKNDGKHCVTMKKKMWWFCTWNCLGCFLLGGLLFAPWLVIDHTVSTGTYLVAVAVEGNDLHYPRCIKKARVYSWNSRRRESENSLRFYLLSRVRKSACRLGRTKYKAEENKRSPQKGPRFLRCH